MDAFQGLVTSLNNKVDALQHELEQLRSQSSVILTELHSLTETNNRSQPGVVGGKNYSLYRSSHNVGQDLGMEHKDVLSDNNFFEGDHSNGERSLSPEVQVQRLTAQLTAAYNRIAALEEQLLAQRIH